MNKRKKRIQINIIICIIIVLISFISIGYSLLSQRLTLKSTTQTQSSKSIGRWNITNSWLDNNIYYYQLLVKIDNKDGPVANDQREMSFRVPPGILIDKCNIWVAETKRLVGDRLYIKCYSWVTEQQPITLGFQLAFSKQTNLTLTAFSFKGLYIADFSRDVNMHN
jgi:hypothetical protein